ncbi:MAG TPA: 50S ribosomal protein L4 [Candidatus Nealsonbacteria bacterium]|uniref:50S ribosomal protein L4 n=1 Tax=marine sediment metagenome TaxID=412755 RepID=A0A0F9X428_9ZZZZ|nr:50S ribosomal protein L4 [Candidatus Nealsonbacteria bacterium]HEB46363.1 50S ribosomal protein L4 [Candidatus Nealsonbacteria bacterium]
MKIEIYNQNGEKIGQVLLPKEIFDIKINLDLVHQVLVSQMANRRRVIAHTKGRGEVRGGGRKPWRQKGTGRARASSIRSPIWRGGGVTFGPTKDRVFKKKINKKMKRKALLIVLSAKAKEKLIIVLDDLKLEKPKTKEILNIFRKILSPKISALIALPKKDEKILRAGRNIPGLQIMEARNLNVFDLLSSKYLIMPKETIKTIKETFLNQSTKHKVQRTKLSL